MATRRTSRPRGLRLNERIRRRTEFKHVYEKGTRVHGRYSTIFVLPNSRGVGRLGIAATKKLGGAVQRNRAKRLIREVFRRNKIASGFDVVVVPRRELLEASLSAIETDYRSTLERRLRQRRDAVRLPVRLALGLIRAYKVLISPYFAGSCRFLPTCADYAAEAVGRHGVIRGGWLRVETPRPLPPAVRRGP